MAKNPMQKKVRNSFILGTVITLLITGIVIAVISVKFVNFKKDVEAKENALKEVYILKSDVKAGDSISADKLTVVKADAKLKTNNAFKIGDITEETIAKIDLQKGTVLQPEMLTTQENVTTDNMRLQEYNMIVLPAQTNTQEYVDIKLRLPSGVEYIVLSKKRIEVPQVSGTDLSGTIWLKLTEEEIKTMSSAIVETYIIDGAMLYTSKYIEPGMQKAATETYVPSNKVRDALNKDPNIEQKAKDALNAKYNSLQSTRNDEIQSILNKYTEEEAQKKVESKMQEEAKKMIEERKKYLDSLNGTAE